MNRNQQELGFIDQPHSLKVSKCCSYLDLYMRDTVNVNIANDRSISKVNGKLSILFQVLFA